MNEEMAKYIDERMKEFKEAFLKSFVSKNAFDKMIKELCACIFDQVNEPIMNNHKYAIENNIELLRKIDELSLKYNDIILRLFDMESKIDKIYSDDKISSLKKTILQLKNNIDNIEIYIKEKYLAQIYSEIKKLESKYQFFKDEINTINKSLPNIIANVVGEVVSSKLSSNSYPPPLLYQQNLTY